MITVFRNIPSDTSDRIILGCAAALVFLWPIANVMAARKILLAVLLVWLTFYFIRDPELRSSLSFGKLVPASLICLAFWMLIVTFAIDANPERSLDELRGEWLPAFASFWIGGLLAVRMSDANAGARTVMRPLFFALVAVAAAQFGIALWYWATVGEIPGYFGGISNHKWTITHVNTITACLLLSELLTVDQSSKPLGLSRKTLVISFFLVFFTTYISGTRNGILVLLLMMLIAACIWVFRVGRRRPVLFLGSLGLSAAVACVAVWMMLKVDTRWERFVQTVPIAWNIDASDNWVNAYDKGLPVADDGLPVDQATYERIAWARAASRFVAENPLGVGVTGSAFRERMQAIYGNVTPAHSHNGYLDFALAVGIPGLALWLIFIVGLAQRGAVAGFGVGAGTGIALTLLAIAFSARAVLDSSLSDHILEQFMFFAGLLLAAVGLVLPVRDQTRLAADDI